MTSWCCRITNPMRERDKIASCVQAERNTSNKKRVLVILNEGKSSLIT